MSSGARAREADASTAGRIWQIPSVEDTRSMKNWLARFFSVQYVSYKTAAILSRWSITMMLFMAAANISAHKPFDAVPLWG